MKLNEVLDSVKKLALNTTLFIYFMEAHKQYDALVNAIFQCINDGWIVGVTSVITVAGVFWLP